MLLLGTCNPKENQTHQDAFPASVCLDWKVSARQRLSVAAADVAASTVKRPVGRQPMLGRDCDDISDAMLRYILTTEHALLFGTTASSMVKP